MEVLEKTTKPRPLPGDVKMDTPKKHTELVEGLVHDEAIAGASASNPIALLSANGDASASNSALPPVSSSSTFLDHSEFTPLLSLATNENLVPEQPHWTEYFWRFCGLLTQCCGVRTTSQQPFPPDNIFQENPFVCNLVLEVYCLRGKDGQPLKRIVKALVDTGSPFNLMSRRLAEDMFTAANKSDILTMAEPKPIIVTLGHHGGKANAIMEIEARWGCEKHYIKHPYLSFDPMMYNSKFQIMEDSFQYDVIVGVEDIMKFGLLAPNAKLPLAAAGWRSSLPSVKRTCVTDTSHLVAKNDQQLMPRYNLAQEAILFRTVRRR
jgi:hypothetical protein